ncbi:glycerophosphodiester phosphodiesterase family protein [Sphingobium quisquiliarum]|uniref:glycerophosphodiester phosphodiesterase family protein n=1 Tax=Sphingobium quisquiliarum TaxID=538379 RepID=UPI0022A9D3C6|nr:glycerophosphodiester phosphodiesterase family protein [Sphingobium quisquiliarum]
MTERPFAHRGLHGPGVSENGMAAFRAAIAAGHGIECDVRLSRDGVAMVFHDAALSRMTGVEGELSAWTAARLDQMTLRDGGTIPRLDALLALCGTEVPLLIEIKVMGRHAGPVCEAVARDLARHSGAKAAVMSFNPIAMRWFARRMPRMARGLVVTEQGAQGWRAQARRGLALWLAQPDFVACDIRDLPSPLSTRARDEGLPVLTWTVRTDDDRARAARHANQIIFEAAGD